MNIKYIDNSLNCYFCGNMGRFINITQGFKDLCNNKECVSKSRSTSSLIGVMYKNNCNKKEAELILKEKNIKRSQSVINTTKKKLKQNPNYTKENSIWNKEYWIKHHNYTEEEAIEKVSKVQRENNSKVIKHRNHASLDLWMERGYTEDEAKLIISELQKNIFKR